MMLLSGRLFPVVLLLASLCATAQATGTSRLPAAEPGNMSLIFPLRDVFAPVGVERPGPDPMERGLGLVSSPSRVVREPLPVVGDRASTTVPLPTSLSLFGAAVLMLGVLGVASGAQRRPVLETGWISDYGTDSREAAMTPRFRIEVGGERGLRVRHTHSARAAIDLIADLLNEGWDLLRICDRDGLAIDYEDLIAACRHERSDR